MSIHETPQRSIVVHVTMSLRHDESMGRQTMSESNGNIMTYSNGRPYKKKPLDPHLFAQEHDGVDDVRVQTGYPIWNLIGAWIACGYNDDEVMAGYSDMPSEEWQAAKQYYFDHKIILDAKLITNTQPYADEDTPPMNTVEDYFAWLARRGQSEAQPGFTMHG
jgi:uncharacterized protein (DUF433 family)